MAGDMKTSDAVKNRAQAGGVMYGGRDKPAGDDLWDDAAPEIKAMVLSGTATMTSTGLTIHRELDEAEWKTLYTGIRRLKQSFSWIIGDWMLYGADRDYIKTYEDMAEFTGLKAVTVKNYAYVCRNVNPSLRSDELSFAHFQVIAALPEDDKATWIHKSIDGGLSVKKLSAAIQKHYKLPVEAVAALPSPDTLTDKNHRKPFNRIFTNLSRGTPERIHRTDFAAVRDWLDKAEQLIQSQNVKLKK